MIKKYKIKRNRLLKNKITNFLLKNGNKKTSENLFLTNIKAIQKYYKKNHKNVFKIGIINSLPIVDIKKIKRKRKRTKEFPFILKKKIRISLSIKWILRVLTKNFINEFIIASKNSGNSVTNKKNIHEHAFFRKKYANYRWF